MHSITLVAQDYFINFFISLFASTGFLVLLIILYRHQIRISDRICIDKKDGKNIYIFKIVNCLDIMLIIVHLPLVGKLHTSSKTIK